MSTRRSERPEPRRVRYQRVLILLVGGMLMLLAGAARLQLLQHDKYKDLAERNWLRLEILRAPRGRIFDTSGVLLADNAPAFSVVFQPPPVGSSRPDTMPADRRAVLRSILGLPDSVVRAVVHESSRTGIAQPFRRDVPDNVLAAVDEHLSEMPGVEILTEPRRAYPESTRAAHVMGYAGEISQVELDSLGDKGYRSGDLIGRAGLEASYERELRGEDGRKILVVNAAGRRVRLFEEEKPILPVAGHDLVLTLDVKLQRALELAMINVKQGSAVAIDPRSGGVLALVSRPSFDPNEFARGLSRARWNELVNDPEHPLLNRATQAAYPPGSTFKVVTSLAGLAEGVLTPDSHFAASCGGGYLYGGRFYKCWDHKGHGTLSLLDALARSCDVYFYQAGLHLGLKRLTEWARRLHLGERSGIDLPQERSGLVPTLDWYAKVGRKPTGGAALNIAIGQGELLLTPLQLAMLAATVASRGHVPHPHLVKEIRDPQTGVVRHVEPNDKRSIDVKNEDWDILIEAMERVVAGGTGGRSKVPGLRVAGKTGTAQNAGNDHALFIAFAPVEAPRVAIAVVVENGGHGGDAAAPVAGYAFQTYLMPDRPVGPAFTAQPVAAAPKPPPVPTEEPADSAD